MERGTVDGISSAPFDTWVNQGCQALTKYVAQPGHLQSSPVFMINLNAWNKLPPDLQKVINDAMGLIFIVGTDITLRYFFYRPLRWVKEVSEYILVVLGFLVAAWILKDDGHLKMELVLIKVSPRLQTMVNIITCIISTIVVFRA